MGPGTLWIIDGYNLIRRDPRLSETERDYGAATARSRLESELSRFRARKGRGHAVVVIYDGVDDRARSTRKGLRIVFPPRGRNADDEILREARRMEGRGDVRIVTSDVRDIRSRLRGLRISPYSSEEFAELLWEGIDDAAHADEKPEDVTGAEVDYWLGEFSDENDGPNAKGPVQE